MRADRAAQHACVDIQRIYERYSDNSLEGKREQIHTIYPLCDTIRSDFRVRCQEDLTRT